MTATITATELKKQVTDLIKNDDSPALVELLAMKEAWPRYYREEALMQAAGNGRYTLVVLLLDAGTDPNGVGGGKQGYMTPLHHAARQRHAPMLALLLERGADGNDICSQTHTTPLQELLGKGYVEADHLPLVRQLLDSGVDPNLRPRHINSRFSKPLMPLQQAIQHKATATAQLLLDYGADINQRNGDYKNALQFATERGMKDGDRYWLEWLLARGADLNAAERHDKTPLTLAAHAGRVDWIEYLVEKGANPRIGRCLSEAVQFGGLAATRRLLELGANVTERDVFETAPLISAITSHKTEMVKLLLDYGAPFDQPTKTYKGEMTPLDFARESPHYNEAIIADMVRRMATQDEARAKREAHKYQTAGLLKVARDPRIGKPIAHWLANGADPTARNEYGRTALHYLVERGRPLAEVTLLLQAGADPNARDPFGYTPLHDAALGNNHDIINALLSAGADPSATVERGIHTGYTPLEIARIEERAEAIRQLTPISPPPRSRTPCQPERRKDGTVKGFSHFHYEEDVAKNKEGRDIYMRKTGTTGHWIKRRGDKTYAEPCVCTQRYDLMSEYHGAGIPRAEHPLRWRIAMEACLHCASEDIRVIYASWGVQPHDGDLVWSYELICNECGYYSSWGYDEG